MNSDKVALSKRRERIRRISRLLMSVSFFWVLAGLAFTVTVFFIPAVSVAPTYRNPAAAVSEGSVAVAGSSAANVEHRNRLYVDLHGSAPVIRVFSFDPDAGDQSNIQIGRVWLARIAALVWMLWFTLGGWLFLRLFAAYETGEVFSSFCTGRLKWVGWWMIGLWCVSIFFQLSKVWWHSTQASFSFDLGIGLLPGIFICLIAWIMEEGHELAEESTLTV